MNNQDLTPQEMRIGGVGIDLAGSLWGPNTGQRFIGLHGWLDNAASLEPLARRLLDIQLMALDMAGHGQSDFRSADSGYDLHQDVGDVIAVADELEWERFGLIGHSRGAMVAAMTAGAFADRVDKLILIDGGAPPHFETDASPAQLQRSIKEHLRLAHVRGTHFASREEAIGARANGQVPISMEEAGLLAERALQAEGGGFRWRADQRLKAASARPLDRPTVEAFFRAIQCPVLQIEAEDGLLGKRADFGGPTELLSDLTSVKLPGDHHLHMSNADQVAAAIQDWLEGHS